MIYVSIYGLLGWIIHVRPGRGTTGAYLNGGPGSLKDLNSVEWIRLDTTLTQSLIIVVTVLFFLSWWISIVPTG